MNSMYGKYTVPLVELMRSSQVNPLLTNALSTYPLYQPEDGKKIDLIPTREELNARLLNHYKYREIGFETVGRFLDELEITMKEIMPYYNERFKTIQIMAELENPFDNVDVIETIEEDTSNESTGTSSGKTNSTDNSTVNAESTDESSTTSNVENNSKHVKSNTPQDQLNITAADIENVPYADEVTWNKDKSKSDATTGGTSSTSTESSNTGLSESEGESHSNSTGNMNRKLHRKGNHGVNTFAHDIMEYRRQIIDTVDEIVTDYRVRELFMTIF